MKTSSAPVYLRTIKEMNDFTTAGQSWNLDGLRIFIKSPDPDNSHFTQPFRTDSYWVLLVMENSITIQLNGEEHIAKENDLLIIPPHVVRLAKGVDDDCKAACVAFTPEFLLGTGLSQRYIDLFDFLFNSGHMHIQMAAEDASRFMTVITMLREKNFAENDHPFTAEVVRHFFNVFQFELAGLYHKYSNQKKTVHDHKEELLWRFLALLSKHVKTERGLQFYANRLFVTAKYLTQTVKKLSGRTAGEYIDELVIVEAKNLLRDPSLTIAQVADRLYFGDQFIFSKFFKRYTGITPSDYRKSA